LAPVEEIVEYVSSIVNRARDFAGRKVLVTAGPTIEDIDPVRYISNRSSGKMGFAIAQAARDRGANVVLVSGPTELQFPNTIRVRTTDEMRHAVLENASDADVVIKAAAPLDYRPKTVASQKIKKGTSDLTLHLERTVDILKELGSHKNGRLLVGFAAETENHVKYGLEKLKTKNLDLIIVNPASGPDSAFDSDMNHATLIDASGHFEEIPLVSKRVMADKILDRVVQLLTRSASAKARSQDTRSASAKARSQDTRSASAKARSQDTRSASAKARSLDK
jgi:phosphopantothenoylcysteine decarboxylase/phosphopantothenate--cysteine ligase